LFFRRSSACRNAQVPLIDFRQSTAQVFPSKYRSSILAQVPLIDFRQSTAHRFSPKYRPKYRLLIDRLLTNSLPFGLLVGYYFSKKVASKHNP
jgi:hypothetical protein